MPTNPSKTPSRRPARRLVRKAKPGEDWVACFDQNGNLIGVCPPDAITPVANADGSTDAATAKAGKALPKPQVREQAEAAAGEDPAMGVAKRMAEVRKGLNGSGGPIGAAEQAALAEKLNRAAVEALDVIHGRRATRRG